MCEHENIIKRAEATASRMLGEGDQHAATTIQELLEALAEEIEAAENWRRLALQFDNHRMQALGHLKAVVNPGAVFDAYKAAKDFLNAPPLGGEEVLAQRLAELAATPAANGSVIRWVSNGVIGACPTTHDLREAIAAAEDSLKCDCGDCTKAQTDTPKPPMVSQAQRVPLNAFQRRAIFDDLYPHGATSQMWQTFSVIMTAVERFYSTQE